MLHLLLKANLPAPRWARQILAVEHPSRPSLHMLRIDGIGASVKRDGRTALERSPLSVTELQHSCDFNLSISATPPARHKEVTRTPLQAPIDIGICTPLETRKEWPPELPKRDSRQPWAIITHDTRLEGARGRGTLGEKPDQKGASSHELRRLAEQNW